MSAPPTEPRIERATSEDIPALSEMRAEQGWHPNARLLRAIGTWDGGRIFVIRRSALAASVGKDLSASGEWARQPVATVVAIAAGSVGVIGNVIVAAQYRRRGLARVLMEAALRWQHERGVQHVLLAATPDGRPLYRRLGFVDTKLSWVAYGPVANLDLAAIGEKSSGVRAHLAPDSALDQLAALDAQAFGGDRMGLLEALLRQSHAGNDGGSNAERDAWLYVAEADHGEPGGYLILRRPYALPEMMQIGPWVAKTPQTALALVGAAFAADAPWRKGVSSSAGPSMLAVGGRREAMELLVSVGATLGEDDIVMQLDFLPGSPPASSAATGAAPQPVAMHPEWLYAWLAPMVF